jgi:hypothetical protein
LNEQRFIGETLKKVSEAIQWQRPGFRVLARNAARRDKIVDKTRSSG